jgi:hypothetical protein
MRTQSFPPTSKISSGLFNLLGQNTTNNRTENNMLTYDDVRLHQRLKNVEAKLAEQQQQEEQPETAAQKIANLLRENARAAELQHALENENSENPVKRLAARIQLELAQNDEA